MQVKKLDLYNPDIHPISERVYWDHTAFKTQTWFSFQSILLQSVDKPYFNNRDLLWRLLFALSFDWVAKETDVGEDFSANRKYSFIQNDQKVGCSGKLNFLNALDSLPYTITSFLKDTKPSRKSKRQDSIYYKFEYM